MMSEQLPVTSLSALTRADGSTTYAYNGFTIVAAVNGPIEVQKRDELPEEAVLDVSVRPAAGVGSTTTSPRTTEILPKHSLRHKGAIPGVGPAENIAPCHICHRLSPDVDSTYTSSRDLARG